MGRVTSCFPLPQLFNTFYSSNLYNGSSFKTSSSGRRSWRWLSSSAVWCSTSTARRLLSRSRTIPSISRRAGPAQIQGFKQSLQATVQDPQLQSFYPPNSPVLDQIANKAAQQVPGLCQRWRIPMEIGNDLVKLGLYDIVIYIDDSGSMQFEEGGERIKDLRLILERVASVATILTTMA